MYLKHIQKIVMIYKSQTFLESIDYIYVIPILIYFKPDYLSISFQLTHENFRLRFSFFYLSLKYSAIFKFSTFQTLFKKVL